jgi:hypothetical protein
VADDLVLFLMRLAASDHRLARWEDLLDELTPRQVTVLQAFAQIEGWGKPADDYRAAVETTILASAWGGKPDFAKIQDAFRPQDRPKPKELTPDQIAQGMRRLQHGGNR